jgi:hypothetical protein
MILARIGVVAGIVAGLLLFETPAQASTIFNDIAMLSLITPARM